jgi:hypothetical protein
VILQKEDLIDKVVVEELMIHEIKLGSRDNNLLKIDHTNVPKGPERSVRRFYFYYIFTTTHYY